MVKILAAVSILNIAGLALPLLKKVAALVARASCSGANHSSSKGIGEVLVLCHVVVGEQFFTV